MTLLFGSFSHLVPGLIAGIQAFGELFPCHPHIHAIASDGGFSVDNRVHVSPRDTAGLQ